MRNTLCGQCLTDSRAGLKRLPPHVGVLNQVIKTASKFTKNIPKGHLSIYLITVFFSLSFLFLLCDGPIAGHLHKPNITFDVCISDGVQRKYNPCTVYDSSNVVVPHMSSS